MDASTTPYDPGAALLAAATTGDPRAAARLTSGQQRVAHMLAAQSAGRVLFCRAYGWLAWTGTHWRPDDAVAARNELFNLLINSTRDSDSDTMRAVNACMSDSAQRGVLSIASNLPQFHVRLEDLDTDPYLLNLANGTFDLRTHELRAHDPADHITKVARAAYDPEAAGPKWDEHLQYFQPSAEVRGFLQRFFGMALLGKVTEHVLVIAYGPQGANGKGTTDRAIQYVLGDYATSANQNLLVATRANSADAPSPARFALLGRRYVSMSETEKRAAIAEALMKNLTGGDKISARALHKDEIVFEPSHTLVLYTNHKPQLSGDDSGVWRRVRLVPFHVSRPKDQQDTSIDEQLELEADAILLWMLEGYRMYAEQGLAAPSEVLAATSEYQYEEDNLQQFLDDRTVADPTGLTSLRDIWDAYETYVRENHVTPVAQKELSQRLEAAGYRRVRRAQGAMFKGVELTLEAPVTPKELDD